MANPYHDELGRFTSGPGAGQVGKGAVIKYDGGRMARVEAQDNDRLIVSGQTTDRFGRATYGGMHRSQEHRERGIAEAHQDLGARSRRCPASQVRWDEPQ